MAVQQQVKANMRMRINALYNFFYYNNALVPLYHWTKLGEAFKIYRHLDKLVCSDW